MDDRRSPRSHATCPACGRSLATPELEPRCPACGAGLSETPSKEGTRWSEAPPDGRERGASRELYRIARNIRWLQWIFAAAAAHGALWGTLLPFAALSEPGQDGETRLLVLVAIADLLQGALALLGVLFIGRHPFRWSIAVASGQSLAMALAIATLPLVSAGLCVAMWVLVLPLARLERHRREFPDLRALHYLRSAAASPAGARSRLAAGAGVLAIVLAYTLF